MQELKTIKVDSWVEVPKNFIGIVKHINGTKCWFKEGKRHREDGPASEYPNGNKDWFLENEIYFQIIINDYVVLDHYKGKYGIMWYKLLDKNEIFEYPDIPGLITK